jgi:predicted dehydrogenase
MLAAIAMQGVRLSHVVLGETVLVIGLGLIGQLTVALLNAAGVRVVGTDLDLKKCDLAVSKMAAAAAKPGISAAEVASRTSGGADAVIITASTKSKAPMDLAIEAVRRKGRIVLVGVVGLELDRRPFFFKEAEFVVSCSYGPGRYDPGYEDSGHDYPAAYVRWTEQRNIQAVLDLMGSGRLDVSGLITHRFPVEQAERAYNLIESKTESYLGIVLQYPEVRSDPLGRRIELRRPGKVATGDIRVGVVGVGNFARTVLLPAIRKVPQLYPRLLCSAKGLSAYHTGDKLGFEAVTADEDEAFAADDVDLVFIATRHDQHARQVVKALKARKHVFVEKPLALTAEEISAIEAALAACSDPKPLLMVGFNRRFSPAAKSVLDFFREVSEPLTVSIRFNAGAIPANHWTQADEVGGGRIVGEACHALDLATYLTGSVPVRVFAESIGGTTAPKITDDQCFITVRHGNGSISSVGYLSGGDKAFPKERVEVFGGGRVAVIDDFRDLTMCVRGKIKKRKGLYQDKGHAAEIREFAGALLHGQPSPIPWEDLRAVSLASLLAVRSIRESMPFDVPQVLTS